MPRQILQPTYSRGNNTYDISVIDAVWGKAESEYGFFFFKRDRFGEIIAKHHYGEHSQYGWEIEHIVPLSEGGTNDIENLRPVHWTKMAQTSNGQNGYPVTG
jgi:hypothetical protein